MVKKISFVLVAVLLMSVIVFTGCNQTPDTTTEAVETHKQVSLEFWAAPFGGTSYTTLFALMDVLNKTHPWLRGTIIETKGTWDIIYNTRRLESDEKALVVTMHDYLNYYESTTGAAKTMIDSGEEPIPAGDRKVLASAMCNCSLIVTFNPDIKTGKDLIGKRMAGWTEGSGAYTQLLQMFKIWGISIDDLASYDGMELKAASDALKDGLVDAIMLSEPYMSSQPELRSSTLEELLSNPKPLYRIPIPKEEYEVFAAGYEAEGRFPPGWLDVPAGHWCEDWSGGGAINLPGLFYVYDEMPEEIEYELMKLLFEQSDMISAHGAQAGMLVPSVMSTLWVENEDSIAPGALRYLKEAGEPYELKWFFD